MRKLRAFWLGAGRCDVAAGGGFGALERPSRGWAGGHGLGWGAVGRERGPPPAPGGPLAQIDFVTQTEWCPKCGQRLRVITSRLRTVVTLALGAFEAHEILKACVHCASESALGSPKLGRLVGARQRFGCDLIVRVGLARYREGMQRDEVRQFLHREHGIELSAGTVSALCDRFLLAWSRCTCFGHRTCEQPWPEAIRFILMQPATVERADYSLA